MTFLSIAGNSTSFPTVECSIDWANAPTSETTTWTDVTPYLRSFGFKRGVSHELGRIAPGEFAAVFDNRDGRFDPENSSGAYYPNVKPMRRIRLRLKWSGVEYDAFLGVIQSYPLDFPATGADSTVQIHAYDMTSILGLAPLDTDQASVTIGELTYTATAAGVDGNKVSITYVIPYGHVVYHPIVSSGRDFTELAPLVGSDDSNAIFVILPTSDTSGTLWANSRHIRGAFNTSGSPAASLVTVELIDGSHGDLIPDGTAQTFLTGGTYAESLSSDRISDVLDDVGIPAAFRSIETGYMTVAGASFKAADRRMAIEHLLDVAEAEDGRFYADKAGVLTFENKFHRILDTSSTLTLGDQAGEVRYRDLHFTHDVSEIWNTIKITPSGGTVEEASDATSIASYYPRTWERDLLLLEQLEAADRAAYYLLRYKDPHRRTPSVEVLGAYDTTKWASILARDISDRVTRIRRPQWGGTISDEQHITGIAMSGDGGGLSVAWELSPVDPSQYWLLGDSTYGKLGTTTKLAWA